MKINKLMLCIAVTVATIACDDNNIGKTIAEADSHLVVDSTFTITGQSVNNSKINSRSITQILGVIDSPDYGTLNSDYVTEFMPVSVIDTTGVSVNDIDSIRMSMVMQMGAYSGDSIAPMRVNVYRLNKNLPYPIYSDFDPKDYYSEKDLLGASSYALTMLNQEDTLFLKDSYTGKKIYYREISVKLPTKLAKDLYNLYKEEPEAYKDPELFAKKFPGVYATTSFGRGRVIQIGGTQLNLYYKKHTKTDADKDTIISRVSSYYGTTPEVITNNNIRLKPAKAIEDKIAKGEVIIQAPAGYNAKIKFPTKEIVSKINQMKTEGLTVLNSVKVSFPATEIENSNKIGMPKYLLFIRESKVDEFFSKVKLPDNKDSFYASYNSSTKSYDFSIRAFIKQFLDDNKLPTDEDENLILLPVDAGFEVQNNSSNYYYSNYYGNQPNNILISITPQITLPTMTKIDIKKAKIIVTCSKKDFSR